MKFFIYFIVLILSFSFLYAKKVDKDSIKIDSLDADEEFFNNLQSIRTELEEKDRKIERKKAEIEELKKELDNREINIKKSQDYIDSNIKSFSTKKSEKFNLRVIKLSKVFKTMKPKNVARIIENLPDDLVIAIFLKINDDEIGMIMKYLEPKKAATLSEKFTEWKKKYNLKKAKEKLKKKKKKAKKAK